MAQPLKVTCPSCSSKFHIPLHLVRGKIVSFRCKNCRGTIPVDGRAISSATPQPMQAPTVLPPDAADPNSSFYGDSSMRLSLSDGIVVHEGAPSVAGLQVDTPAAFAHSNPQPPSRPRASFGASRTPPVGFVPSATGSVPPTAISRSHAPDSARVSEPPPSVRRPTSAKKIVAGIALLSAAGLTLWSTSLRHSPRALATATPTSVEHGPTPPRQPTDEPKAAEPQALPPSAPAIVTEPVEISTPTGATTAVAPIEPTLVKRLAPARAGKAHPAKVATDSPAQAPAEEAEPTSQPPAPQAAAPVKPAGAQDTSAAGDTIEFNKEAARQALESAMEKAQSSCRTMDTPAGAARVAVTFAPSGNVISAVIESGLLVGTPAGGCVTSKFRTVRVPAFTGDQVTVHKSVTF